MLNLLVVLVFLSSIKDYKKLNEELPDTLVVYRSVKNFYNLGKNKDFEYVSTQGIWQVATNNLRELIVYKRESVDVPHSVEIKCYKSDNTCTLRETVLVRFVIYAVSSSENTFKVNTWDRDKIIATMYDFEDRCLKRILQIDLHTQEVLVTSIPKDNMNTDEFCSHYKNVPMPIINRLVDESESDWDYSISLTKKPREKTKQKTH